MSGFATLLMGLALGMLAVLGIVLVALTSTPFV